MRAGKFKWEESDIEILKRGLARGDSYDKIGRKLGVSKHAVSGKVDRLNLRQRSHVTTGDYIGQRAKRLVTARITDLKAKEHEKIMAIRISAPPPPVIKRTAIEPCSYVLELKPSPRYCEAPSEPGKSMCKEHHTLCFIPSPKHHDRLWP